MPECGEVIRPAGARQAQARGLSQASARPGPTCPAGQRKKPSVDAPSGTTEGPQPEPHRAAVVVAGVGGAADAGAAVGFAALTEGR
jgi:hypothetical protein